MNELRRAAALDVKALDVYYGHSHALQGVDLTLDTTLNLDDLLSDYAEYRRLHGSAPVQP